MTMTGFLSCSFPGTWKCSLAPLMQKGGCVFSVFLKSVISTLGRLFSVHRSARLLISSRYEVSSLFEIQLMMVVLSANVTNSLHVGNCSLHCRVEDSRDGILCGSVGSEYKLVRVQASWDVVFDVLKNQFLKALHQNGGECHRVVVV